MQNRQPGCDSSLRTIRSGRAYRSRYHSVCDHRRYSVLGDHQGCYARQRSGRTVLVGWYAWPSNGDRRGLERGVIDEQEATRRRDQVQRQADFNGAMDGASKFVRGDAIAVF